ncbi:hypothetical protein DH2020_036030 [Rehmannia glutinosa]|uniref:Bifunctional inhibitor/plant lipid transfer protein/seed storage helical domain-containing protein n=1 Tax=Rehmannia glutinosa TaxID=99300 RepID=A0ABR0V543_REHGL
MEKFTYFPCLVLALAIALVVTVVPVNGQSSTICTGAMLRSFSPCVNFVSSGSNSSSPTQNCCSSLKSLMSNGQDCLCLIVTGGVPFQVPLNRNLAMSLPRACKMSGVPIECKATASPVPAPDPQNSGDDSPSMSPGLSPPSPRAPFIPQSSPPSLAPDGDIVPTEGDIVPTLTPPGMRPTLTTTSAAHPSHSALPSLVVAVLGFILLKFY